MVTKLPPPLRLLAQDAADLEVVAAALQDAVVRPAAFVWEPKARRFTAPMVRYQWERDGARGGSGHRVNAALQVEGVLSARYRGVPLNDPEATTSLLTLSFEPEGDGPGGMMRLVFAGAGEAALAVECVEAALADVSQPWPARRRPDHG